MASFPCWPVVWQAHVLYPGACHGGGMTARAGGEGSGGPDLQKSSSEPIFNSSKTEEKRGGTLDSRLHFLDSSPRSSYIRSSVR